MSVTIRPTGDLGREVSSRPCSACQGGYCQPGWCEDGIEVEETFLAPLANWAEGNAGSLVRLLGDDGYLCGDLPPEEVSSTLCKVRKALRSDAEGLLMRSPMLRQEHETTRVLIAESSDESAIRRLRELETVLVWALENDRGVCWG